MSSSDTRISFQRSTGTYCLAFVYYSTVQGCKSGSFFTFFRIRILIRKVERGGDCPPPPLSPTPGPPLAGPILETSLQGCGSAFISCGSRSSCSPQFRSGSSCFFSDPDPALKMCKQLLYEEYSEVEKTKKIAQNKTRELVQIYLLIKLHFLPVSISLHFFCFFLKSFPPGSGIQEGNRMLIRIHSPASLPGIQAKLNFS